MNGKRCSSWCAGNRWLRLREDGDSLMAPGVPPDERDMLLESRPAVFYFTDHYRDYRMVLVRFSKTKRATYDRIAAVPARQALALNAQRNAADKTD